MIYHRRVNPKISLFFSYFIEFILGLNVIHSDEADLHESPKVFDKSVIKLMGFYPDDDDIYYFFYNHGIFVYEDRIEDP